MSTRDAEKIVAAAAYHLLKLVLKSLVRANRSLKGFCLLNPPVSRLPLPEDVVDGITSALMYLEQKNFALAVFSSAHCYLRPGETINLATQTWVIQ